MKNTATPDRITRERIAADAAALGMTAEQYAAELAHILRTAIRDRVANLEAAAELAAATTHEQAAA